MSQAIRAAGALVSEQFGTSPRDLSNRVFPCSYN